MIGGTFVMNKKKKYSIGMFVSLALMFLWILVAVVLTGGRDVAYFTATDKKVMEGFIAVEIITCIIMFVFAVMAGVQTGKEVKKTLPMTQYAPKTKWQMVVRRRGAVMAALSLICAFFISVAGLNIGKNMDEASRTVFKCIFAVCLVIPIVTTVFNVVLKKLYVRKINNMQAVDLQNFIISHRDLAKETSERKLSLLRRLRIFTGIYAVILLLFGVGLAFCRGAMSDADLSGWCIFVSAILILSALSRIRFSTPKAVFEDDKTYIPESEYPELYRLAERAAEALQCKGRIKISVLPECNAGIAKIAGTYSIQLGVVLLSTMSKEEIYSILLHEFAHIKNADAESEKTEEYNSFLCDSENMHFFSSLTSFLFCYPDTVYSFEYFLYKYAASIMTESAADEAMVRFGNADAAASGLLKIKYFELFNWEKGTSDGNSAFEAEEADKKCLTKEIDAFKEAIKVNSEKWNSLVDVEILSRSATHPTLKMRLDALGVTDYKITESDDPIEYSEECAKALEYIEELIYEKRSKSYEDDRETYYSEPLETVKAWEEAGKKVVAEEYGDVVSALRQLGRVSEANELCERAINSLSGAASCYAYYMLGCYLIHCYDASGIDYIYRAIEENSNYIDEGLEMIGSFCCMTGRQEDLDIYRKKAPEIAQAEKDKYSQVGVLNKKDRLSEEKLPDGMLDDILSYIKSIDNGCIEKIYLVRKTITDDFFTSAFVVKFSGDAKDKVRYDVLHKIFSYLDTCSDWQFSLFSYDNVSKVKVENIPGSCVYSK